MLDDAPEKGRAEAGRDVENAIVHQQDIQAVVNAMWAGGAEAMTIQGQRVISTTGIKCVGNTVILHGVPYSPPYEISAIGDSATDGGVPGRQRLPPRLPAVGLRLRAGLAGHARRRRLQAPAYEGSTDLQYADPAGAATS